MGTCPTCHRRVSRNGNRIKRAGGWRHKRCPKEPVRVRVRPARLTMELFEHLGRRIVSLGLGGVSVGHYNGAESFAWSQVDADVVAALRATPSGCYVPADAGGTFGC